MVTYSGRSRCFITYKKMVWYRIMNQIKSLKVHDLGFRQVTPLPTVEKLSEFYSKKYYQKNSALYQFTYSEKDIFQFNYDLQLKYHAMKKILKSNRNNFLDGGCGEGFALNFFQKLGWQVEGWDFSSYGISKHNKHLINIFKQGDINELCEKTIGLKTFDVVHTSHVLEHVIDPVGLLQLISELLSPDGIILLTVPNYFSELQQLLVAEGYVDTDYWVNPPEQINYFNTENLVKILDFCEFKTHFMFTTFPIDWFLLNTHSNYVRDKLLGKSAHISQLHVYELIQRYPIDNVLEFYIALAKLGMGRNINILVEKKTNG